MKADWRGALVKQVCLVAMMGLLALSGCGSKEGKAESPKTLADVAEAAVVMKYQIGYTTPEERWKELAFIVSEPLRKLDFTEAQIERFAKDIIDGGPYPSREAEIEAVRAKYAGISDPNEIEQL